jgi:hypothetical protein
MDPITTAIVAAIAAGVTSGVTEAGKQAIVDAYEALKTLLKKKFGGVSKVVKAVEEVEDTPYSKGRQQTLQEEVTKAHADTDPELVQAAQALLKELGLPLGSRLYSQTAIGNYIAQAQEGSSASVNVDRAKEP